MQTFLQQSKGSLCNIKLNDFGRLSLMRRSKNPQKPPCPLKTKEPWLSCRALSTVKERDHYKTPSLWKGEPVMPNNRAMVVSRLHATERKLKKDPELALKYKKVINDFVNRRHAKKIVFAGFPIHYPLLVLIIKISLARPLLQYLGFGSPRQNYIHIKIKGKISQTVH